MKGLLRYSIVPLAVLFFGFNLTQADGAADSVRPPAAKNLSHIKFSGGDGSSCQKAIVITQAANNSEGVAAEKAWIARNYPNAKIKGQALSSAKNKTFDTLEIKKANGEVETLCFDITDFFGQW